MTCEAYDWVACAKGELTPAERAEAERHLAGCAACREELRRVREALSLVAAAPAEAPSPGFTRRVMLAARARHPEAFRPAAAAAPAAGWREFLRLLAPAPPWAISVAVHAALLLALSLWFYTQTPVARPPEPVAMRVKPPGRGADGGLAWSTPPRGPAGPIRAVVTPLEADVPDFTDGGPSVDRPVAVPAPPPGPRRNAAGGAGTEGIPLAARIEDRRILAFIEGRADARRRREALAAHGGDGTEDAVLAALRWLAARQEKDGSWEPSRFGGLAEHRTGCTGLAALAFLGAGHAHQAGPFRGTVAAALRFLAAAQQGDGCVGGPGENVLYGHALGTLALLEAHCLTDDPALRPPIAAAVGFTQFAQNDSGGWGYAARDGRSDASVTGWQMMVLELARARGFLSAATSLRRGMEWLDGVTAPDGRVGYRAAGHHPNGAEALTAVGMFVHQLVVPVRDAARLNRQAARLAAAAPAGDLARSGAEAGNDFYGWYFTSLALFQHGGDAWTRWNAALTPRLLAAQEKAGDDAGAWPAFDRWSGYGGRVYTTAMGALILETYYRYPRLGR